MWALVVEATGKIVRDRQAVLSSYNFCKTILEPPKYEIQDVYRALSVIAEESDFIQSEMCIRDRDGAASQT